MKLFAKVLVGVAVAGVTAVVGSFAYDSYDGRALIRELCSRDGGLRSFRLAEARGIMLRQDGHERRCMQCLDWLMHGTYEYVDMAVGRAPTPGAGTADTREYFRYQLGQVGDANCVLADTTLTAESRATIRQDEVRAGVGLSQCLAVEHLPGRPAGFSFAAFGGASVTNQRRHHITVDVQAYLDNDSGEVVSSYKNYRGFSRFDTVFLKGTATAAASASCTDPTQVNRDSLWFKSYGLRRAAPGVHVPAGEGAP